MKRNIKQTTNILKTMRLSALFLLSIGFPSLVVNGDRHSLRGVRPHRRLLPDWPWAFLVSHVAKANGQDWCITAKHGVTDGSNLGFLPCDFASAADDQLFMLDQEGKIHSKVDPDQCFVIDDGTAVEGGFRVKFCACNEPVTYTTFEHDRSTADVIRVKNDSAFCLKQTGNGPDTTDTIRTERCDETNPCFIYEYKEYACSLDLRDVDCCATSDCGRYSDICVDYQCVCSTSQPGVECCTSADCGTGLSCANNVCETCTDECCSDFDCPIGYACRSGMCVAQGAFLVSAYRGVDGQEWCIAANHGLHDFAEIGFEPCDFTYARNTQLWHHDTHNMIHSDADMGRCMIVGPGGSLIDGQEIHIAPCKLNTFIYDSVSDHIHLGQDTSYCLTGYQDSLGSSKMRGRLCQNTDRFRFVTRPV